MSKRVDIIDGRFCGNRRYGLIYTCKCGWIDLGHAIPDSAAKLWSDILQEKGTKSRDGKGFKVSYSQAMRFWKFSDSAHKDYYVQLGLSIEKKESVALSIFMETSIEFEKRQGHYFLDSSFSGEDLISDLIGFYRAVRPGKDYIFLSQPVSKEAAYKVWDESGSVGKNKNRSFTVNLYPCSECNLTGAACAPLPAWLNTIKQASKGILFRDWHPLKDIPLNFHPFK